MHYPQKNKDKSDSWLNRNNGSQKTMKWHPKVLKENNRSSGMLYLINVPLKIQGERKTFSDNQKWREFVSSKPTVKERLRGIIREGGKWS